MCTLQWVIRKSEIGPERAPLSEKDHIIAEKEWKRPPPRQAEEYIRENLSSGNTIKHLNDSFGGGGGGGESLVLVQPGFRACNEETTSSDPGFAEGTVEESRGC